MFSGLKKVLVVGSGAREHALCRTIRQSPLVGELLASPGNAGIGELAQCIETPSDPQQLARFAADLAVDFTVIGPELPLCNGVADAFSARGLRLFGPTQAAAAIEGSKIFAKELFARHGIPTARFGVFEDVAAAEQFVDRYQGRVVVKADGLAAGKGVVVADTVEQARMAVREALVHGCFGEAGKKLVIEERLTGIEASLMVLTDEERVISLEPAQDHKRLLDGDLGPNTGGMGAVSPTRALPPDLVKLALMRIVMPTVRALAAEGRPFRGLLYAGLMIVDGEPQVLEFNCRFGDPETQAVLPRLAGDIVPALVGCAEGKLEVAAVPFRSDVAVACVMASAGYPGPVQLGQVVTGLDDVTTLRDVVVAHGGTRRDANQIVTAGGRVLTVTGLGANVEIARRRAYDGVSRIHFDGMQYRKDIGARETLHA